MLPTVVESARDVESVDAPAGTGNNSARRDLDCRYKDWHQELFQPCVAAGLIPTRALAGYRQESVYLRTSRYVPPRWETVREAMPALLDLLEAETEPSVRAVLGHWLFGYIHGCQSPMPIAMDIGGALSIAKAEVFETSAPS